jgi:hypothetical protein
MTIEENRHSVYGWPGKPPVGAATTKEKGWTVAAEYIKTMTGLSLSLDATRRRMTRYKNLYKDCNIWASKTGAGMPEDSSAQSFQEYLEELCPYYSRLDTMFQNSPHIQPHCEMSMEMGVGMAFSSRSKKYAVGAASTGEVKGGNAAQIVLDKDGQQKPHEDQIDHEYGESGLRGELGIESEEAQQYNAVTDYNDGPRDQAQSSQATVNFQGPELRTPS